MAGETQSNACQTKRPRLATEMFLIKFPCVRLVFEIPTRKICSHADGTEGLAVKVISDLLKTMPPYGNTSGSVRAGGLNTLIILTCKSVAFIAQAVVIRPTTTLEHSSRGAL